ncbi:MAG TPA: ABC transporter substrate-binding protein [Ideonella sp.]|uniref:ABC transporter substrate-binding protein n=1 Tax=Ideonella sp. TaxID=1929293 RepID=UPI002D1559B8|nr:ABC transporter substrate-binding protein [Ideonella sp.]HSI47197.1 ABC transporter substrate-binding protein [Ideonella sp.]
MTVDHDIRAALMPTGVLRASINLGNPILARWDLESQQAMGVSVDLATELAKRLAAKLQLVVFDAAGKSVAAVTEDAADVGFFALDPLRSQGLYFTAPYVLIEGSYLVRMDSPLLANDQVDAAGLRVMVGRGSAYDLYLTRELKHAQILRAPTSPTVVDEFLAQATDVAAGVRQQLEADALRLDGLRVLPGRFMVIQQAMGLPRSRGLNAAAFMIDFVEDMKRSGFVTQALERHRIQGAVVAPQRQE